MTAKSASLMICALLACALSACPRADTAADAEVAQQAPGGSPGAVASENPHDSPATEAESDVSADGSETDADTQPVNTYAEGEYAEGPKQAIRDMVQALVDRDLAKFTKSFHPDSPELEEMLNMFNDWQDSGNTIEIASLEVQEAMQGLALVEYEISISEAGNEAEAEKGKMEMMLNDDGAWVIMDME